MNLNKETLYARSQIKIPGSKFLNFPNNLDDEFYEGFCSEVQVAKHRNGHPYMVWEKLPGVRNEPLDLMVYSLAAAHLAGLTRMNWERIERSLQEQISSIESFLETRDPSIDPITPNASIKGNVRTRCRNKRRRRG